MTDEVSPAKSGANVNRIAAWAAAIIVWPAIAFIAAIGVFIVVGVFMFSNHSGEEVSGEHIIGLIFWTGLILATLFFYVSHRLLKKSNPHSRISGKVLRLYTWMGAGLTVVVLVIAISTMPPTGEVYENSSDGSDSASLGVGAHQPTQNPELLSILKQIGATEINDLDINYADSLNNPNWLGSYQEYRWDNDNSFSHGEIKILRTQPSVQDLYRTVAHEYLHHIWASKLDSQTVAILTSDLITMHGRNSYMQHRVNEYSHQGTLLPTEIFAFACSEFSDGWLSEYIRNQCNTYINRSQLQMVY